HRSFLKYYPASALYALSLHDALPILTLRLSKDGGKTWYFNETIAKSPEGYDGAYSAYSDIVLVNKKKIGVLYEKDHYKEIVFVRSEEHTSELQSRENLVCRLLLEKKK